MMGKTRPGTLVLRTAGACDFDPGHLLEVFGEQRRRFIAVLRGFGPADWAAPTRCTEWSAHDVVRHLCDGTPSIAADQGDRKFDLTAGFDPRVSTHDWLAASDGESPAATLGRLEARTEELLARARERLAHGRGFEVRLPYGPMDWTVLTYHIFWDSWIHERDVLLARGTEHPACDDAAWYATAYGLFICAAVASMFGAPVRERLTLGGEGGGIFELDDQGSVTLTATRAAVEGCPAAEVTDALGGRGPVDAVLAGLPAGSRSALSQLGAFFNTPAERSPA